MRRSIVAILALAISSTIGAQPAAAVLFKTAGVSGGLQVYPDFTACLTLTFASGTFHGAFVAAGQMQGPGTKVGTVRAAVPIIGYGTWSYCIPGAYLGATAGEAKFTVVASGLAGEYAEIQQCVVNRGALTCV